MGTKENFIGPDHYGGAALGARDRLGCGLREVDSKFGPVSGDLEFSKVFAAICREHPSFAPMALTFILAPTFVGAAAEILENHTVTQRAVAGGPPERGQTIGAGFGFQPEVIHAMSSGRRSGIFASVVGAVSHKEAVEIFAPKPVSKKAPEGPGVTIGPKFGSKGELDAGGGDEYNDCSTRTRLGIDRLSRPVVPPSQEDPPVLQPTPTLTAEQMTIPSEILVAAGGNEFPPIETTFLLASTLLSPGEEILVENGSPQVFIPRVGQDELAIAYSPEGSSWEFNPETNTYVDPAGKQFAAVVKVPLLDQAKAAFQTQGPDGLKLEVGYLFSDLAKEIKETSRFDKLVKEGLTEEQAIAAILSEDGIVCRTNDQGGGSCVWETRLELDHRQVLEQELGFTPENQIVLPTYGGVHGIELGSKALQEKIGGMGNDPYPSVVFEACRLSEFSEFEGTIAAITGRLERAWVVKDEAGRKVVFLEIIGGENKSLTTQEVVDEGHVSRSEFTKIIVAIQGLGAEVRQFGGTGGTWSSIGTLDSLLAGGNARLIKGTGIMITGPLTMDGQDVKITPGENAGGQDPDTLMLEAVSATLKEELDRGVVGVRCPPFGPCVTVDRDGVIGIKQ